MRFSHRPVEAAVACLRNAVPGEPHCAVFAAPEVTASLGAAPTWKRIPFSRLPGFPENSHHDFAWLERAGGPVLVLPMLSAESNEAAYEVQLLVLAVKQLGIQRVLIAGTAIGVDRAMDAGDMFVVRDHINLTGDSPLIGCPGADASSIFVDMSEPYCAELARKVLGEGSRDSNALHEGVLVCVGHTNPHTEAASSILAACSARAVCRGVVPEVLAAVWAGLKVLACMRITMSHSNLGKACAAATERAAANQSHCAASEGLFWHNCIEQLAA